MTTRTGAETLAEYPDEELALDLRWWAAANYLTVGQIYLQDNALLTEPLEVRHIKPRLLGHWGTSPGLSMVYTLVNRLIRRTGSDWLYVTGPGHGGPALVACGYLEGTYSEIYPGIGRDAEGLRRLFRQFSTPGGVPSHVSVDTPGSIHEGGELGYALAHAAGAAFDHPDLFVACVVGDGEAETGPLAGSWRLPYFANPRRDGAVLPIIHLNGYKIAGPTVLGRTSDEDVADYLSSQGWDPMLVTGDDPPTVFRDLWRPWSEATRRSPPSARRRARATPASRSATAGPPSCCGPPRAGPGRTSSTANRSRGRAEPPGAALRRPGQPGAPAPGSRSGCARTAPTSCSARRPARRELAALAPRATSGCPRRRTPTAAGAGRPARLPTSRVCAGPGATGRPAHESTSRSANCCATSTPDRADGGGRSGSSVPTRRRATGSKRCSR